MKRREKKRMSSNRRNSRSRRTAAPDELGVQGAPSLALASLTRSLLDSVLVNQVGQPVAAAIPQHVAVEEDQLALWPVEPVVVGVRYGHSSLEPWW